MNPIPLKKENNHPELKIYEVWREGFGATGDYSPAQLIGKSYARSFAQACHIVFCTEFLKMTEIVNKPDYEGYVDPDRWDYDPLRLTYWGCRLFNNETDARKSFG